MVSGENSLNDKLKENKTEMASRLQEAPVRDLKKAITINDRHRFIHKLFRGDETMYERSIKTINSFNISAEAEYWIQRELKVKLGWNNNDDLVKTFDQLVKRRFS
jgi:ATP-dependent exoDNAse (exonuclease V) beta subunit